VEGVLEAASAGVGEDEEELVVSATEAGAAGREVC